MVVRVDVSAEVLNWARARSGFGEDEFLRKFPRFTLWVRGDVKPTLKQLESFARRTHTPFGFMFLEAPPFEPVPIPDFRTVADEPVSRPSADLLDTIYICQARQEWYRDHQLMNREDPVPFVGSMDLETPIAIAVRQLGGLLRWDRGTRDQLRSWDNALSVLRERSEAIGILVMISGIVGSDTHRRLDPAEFRGFALADPRAAVVFVNGADSKAAQVFTTAHELAHLLIGGSGLDDLEPRSEVTHAEERWCSNVAAELLAPMDEFRELFDPGLETRSQLQPLAEHFRVSTQVILGRVREAGYLSWDSYLRELTVERERVAGIDSSREGGGNFYYTKPVQVSKRFAGEVIGSALAGWTTYTEAMRLLGIRKMSTFEGLAEQLGIQ